MLKAVLGKRARLSKALSLEESDDDEEQPDSVKKFTQTLSRFKKSPQKRSSLFKVVLIFLS